MGGKRARRKRRRWLWVAAVVLVLAGALAALGYSWLTTYRQAQTASAAVTSLRDGISSKDWAAVATRLPEARAATDTLTASTEGVPWTLLSVVPVIGPTASALHEMSLSLSQTMAAAEPLVPYAEQVTSGHIRTADGAVDVAGMTEVAPLLARLADAFDSGTQRLGLVNADAVRPEVAGPLVELRDAMVEAKPAIDTAAEVATWIPSFLGADKPREWVILLQNPAEARGTGGFVGGFVRLSADQGRVTIEETGTSEDLAALGIPSGGVNEQARQLWGGLLKEWNTFNLSPDFPLTAQLAASGMNLRGHPPDGVIAVDPAAVAAMMQVTGPVTAEGKTLTAEQAAQFFTEGIYREYPDPKERDKVSVALTGAVLQAFMSAPLQPNALADALREPVSNGDIRVWSAKPDEQEWLIGTSVGGGLTSTPGSVIDVAFNNAAGNKIDAFVTAAVDYQPGRCPTSTRQTSSLSVSLTNDAPADLPPGEPYARLDDPTAPLGSTNTLVHVYAPVDANFLSATIDGKPADLYLGFESDRPVWWTSVTTERGQTRTIDVKFEEPTVLGTPPAVNVQPMAKPESITVTPDDTCSPA